MAALMKSFVPDYTLILAAGKGARMGSDATHKVCFELDGVPAVNRTLAAYQECGVRQHLVVVGTLAAQVMATVSAAFPNTLVAFQREANGTAGAVRAALASWPGMDPAATMLIAAGDRIIEPEVLRELFELYDSQQCDIALLALPGDAHSSGGRIVADADGRVLGIVETADLRQRRTLGKIRELARRQPTLSGRLLQEILVNGFFPNPEERRDAKLECAFGRIWRLAEKPEAEIAGELLLELIPEERTRFEFPDGDGRTFRRTPDEIVAESDCNTSVYLVRRQLLDFALGALDRNNAQQEEYLTDLIAGTWRNPACPNPKIRKLLVHDRERLLGFNNPAELLAAETILRRRQRKIAYPALPEGLFRPIAEWRRRIAGAMEGKGDFTRTAEEIYGSDPEVLKRQLTQFLPLLDFAAGLLSADAPVGLVRSPGRVNVMGRHVDHQGGNCNLMTIGYETILLIHPREDDRFRLHHLDGDAFQPAEFSISEELASLPWDDWQSLVDSPQLARLIREYGVDWSHYIKAAVLRLQKQYPHQQLRGLDICVAGNVPMAAGLSSSSSLVVGAAEAVVAANALPTHPDHLVSLCGEGEWFVGTRGGSADHAAVKLGRKASVIKVRFFNFEVEEILPFPDDYVMAVCDSGIVARKSSSARDQFNHRVSCYRIGLKLLQKHFPQYHCVLRHLRDVNAANLGMPLSGIYRMLLKLPERAGRPELQAMLPDEDLQPFWANHAEPADGFYPIRGVVLYGLAECARSARYADYLKAGDMTGIGELMRHSHDGDRVAGTNTAGDLAPFQAPTDDATVLRLIDDLESGDPDRVTRAQLEYQPGAYGCSLPEIDRMVDIALSVPGVIGAQLAGAGLGGCMMVLMEKRAVSLLENELQRHYFSPSGRPASVLVCQPTAGAGLLK